MLGDAAPPASGFTFGGKQPAAAAPQTGGFVFGKPAAPTTTASSSVDAKPAGGFVFGKTTTAPASSAVSSTSTPAAASLFSVYKPAEKAAEKQAENLVEKPKPTTGDKISCRTDLLFVLGQLPLDTNEIHFIPRPLYYLYSNACENNLIHSLA